MKIALVSQEYPPETARGGIGSQTLMKARGLAALGHEVFVISRSTGSRTEIRDGEISVIRIPGLEDALYHMTDIVQWITYSSMVAVEIDNLNKRVGLDLIDFAEWGAEGYVYLLNRTGWYGVPVVLQLHGPLVMFAHTMNWPERNSPFYRVGIHMEATCVNLCDAVYASGSCSAEWVQQHYNAAGLRIPTIHAGIDTGHFRPLAMEKEQKTTIIFLGRIVKNKGVQELIEAAGNLLGEFPDLQLRLFGSIDENYRNYLLKKYSHFGDQLLDFRGYMDKDQLPEELCRAHIFAVPSYFEGGPGFAFLEAMACGLPVIGCTGSGLEDIIQDGINGFLVPPRDSRSLQNVLRRLLSDTSLMQETGIRARDYVLREADTRQKIKSLEEFYYSVLEKQVAQTASIDHHA